MVAFLLFQNCSPGLVGVLRGICVTFEISATSIAPWLMSKIGPVRSGLWFINFQSFCISFTVLALYMSNVSYSVIILVTGVIFSRLGLWGFDLCARLQIQEGVEAQNRAKFSSVEASVQSMFELLSFLSTIVCLSTPQQFKIPALLTVFSIFSASLLYTRFVYVQRKHIFHFEKFLQYLRKN